MADFDRLILQVSKASTNMGGLVSLLLAIKGHKSKNIKFNPRTLQFYVDGKAVSLVSIRHQLGRIELALAALIIDYNDKLFNKVWTLKKWQDEMEKLVQNGHYIFAAFALGGLGVAINNAIVNRKIERDTNALARFAAALRAKQVPSLPLANNRGRTYLRSIYTTFWILDHRMHVEAGYTEAKRVLTPAEHCHNRLGPGGVQEGCYEAALRSWMPIAEMPPIGTLVCGQFCKCYLVYK
jgi:hypothetical protein